MDPTNPITLNKRATDTANTYLYFTDSNARVGTVHLTNDGKDLIVMDYKEALDLAHRIIAWTVQSRTTGDE